MSINPQQAEAIDHNTGPMMVLAGPGSGKTFVITNRIKTLIEKYGVPPSTILVITFTKASALEMQQRFNNLMDDVYCPVNFGTFHAIYFHILKETYHYDFSNIITEKEKRTFLKTILSDYNHESVDSSYEERILSDISRIKNDGIKPEEYHVEYMPSETFVSLFHEYQNILKEHKKLDFEDMVLSCKELFEKNKNILYQWQSVYQYILIDEFQDINPMQYHVVKMLVEPKNNLFVVGDDDQSIYGFRGSKPEIMLGFNIEFADCKTVVLNKNYRSTSIIVDTAQVFIRNNKNRYDKSLSANKAGGSKILVDGFESEEDENDYIVRLIRTLKRKSQYNDIALIFRTNSLARKLTQVFYKENIPFRFKEKPKNLLEHFAVKDVMAILAFAYGETTRANLFVFMNKPVRYIKRIWFTDELADLNALLRNNEIADYAKDNIKKLIYDLNVIQSFTPYAAINYIRKGMGYDEYNHSKYGRNNPRYDEINESLSLLSDMARDSSDYIGLKKNIDDYSENMLKESNEESDADAVTFITMHGSKGLEYKHVILPGVNEGNVPSKKAVMPEEIEEERRVFYVAMTRAKDNLYITYRKSQDGNRLRESRFLKETGLI